MNARLMGDAPVGKNLMKMIAVLLAASCAPAASPAQDLFSSNAENWTFNMSSGIEDVTCNLQTVGYTRDGLRGPLVVLQYQDGFSTLYVTFDNLDQDVMTIYNTAGSAFARIVMSSASDSPDQSSFVPDFPIYEVFSVASQLGLAEQQTPNNPYAFVDFPRPPFNALEDWHRCVQSF